LSRQESQARTRARLLKAAAKVLLRDGFHAASIGQIANAAGYTTGAVYSNFESKEELCLAVLEDRFLNLASELTTALAAAAPNVDARMTEVEAWYENILGQEQWGLLAAEFALATRKKAAIRNQLADRIKMGRAMIGAVLAQQYEQLHVELPVDTDRLAAAVLGLAIGMAVQRVVDPDIPTDTFPDGVRVLLASWNRPSASA
jgi:AcrR family transcriptional regulator